MNKERIFSKQDTNVIKGIAILFMMYHHCFATVDRFENYTVSFFPLSEAKGVLLSFTLKICVGMFVFLSAYGMTISLKKAEEKMCITGRQLARMTTARLVNMLSGYMFIFILVHVISIVLGKARFTKVYGTGSKAAIAVIIDFFGLGDVFGTPMYMATWWYMSVAIILILILPLLVCLYRKIGVYAILLVTLLPYILTFQYNNITRYLLVMILGVVLAETDGIVKVSQWKIRNAVVLSKIIKIIVEVLAVYLLFKGRTSKYSYQLVEIWDSLIPLVIILFAYEFIVIIPGIRQVLSFLGKHSMNIFLTHNFFRVFWCPDVVYSFRSAWIIPLVLLIITLIFSIMVELLKKLIRFESLVNWIKNKIIPNNTVGGSNEK